MSDPSRDRNEAGQYADRIPVEAALSVFEEREDAARPLTASDVMEALDCSRRTAHNKLNELVDRGRLETRKIGARGRVWWVPLPVDEGSEALDSAAVDVTDATVSDGRDPTDDVRSAVAEAELPGSGATLEARHEALLAAYDYLVEHPSASRSDFVEHVYPDHPAGFETAAGWWNAIQPALKGLPGVDPPEERGHLWKFLGGDRFKPTLG